MKTKPPKSNFWRRRRYLVAPHLQTPLLMMSLRHAGYMVLVTVICLFLPQVLVDQSGNIWTRGSPEGWVQLFHLYKYFLPALILGLVTIFYDSLRVSHRFVGPLHRIRAALEDAAAGKTPPPIKLREKDYLKAEAEAANRLMAYAARPRTEAGDSPARIERAIDRALEELGRDDAAQVRGRVLEILRLEQEDTHPLAQPATDPVEEPIETS